MKTCRRGLHRYSGSRCEICRLESNFLRKFEQMTNPDPIFQEKIKIRKEKARIRNKRNYQNNIEKYKETNKIYKENNKKEAKKYSRNWKLKKNFGITEIDYNQKLFNQNQVCYICKCKETSVDPRSKTTRNLAVDHCHKTGKVRDLLCRRCNQTLGLLEESEEIIESMLNYCKKWKNT